MTTTKNREFVLSALYTDLASVEDEIFALNIAPRTRIIREIAASLQRADDLRDAKRDLTRRIAALRASIREGEAS
jgi:hypothetical protein